MSEYDMEIKDMSTMMLHFLIHICKIYKSLTYDYNIHLLISKSKNITNCTDIPSVCVSHM